MIYSTASTTEAMEIRVLQISEVDGAVLART
jgi:hypothetical protein